MTEMLEPMPGESIYDSTCGSAGILLFAVAHLKRQNIYGTPPPGRADYAFWQNVIKFMKAKSGQKRHPVSAWRPLPQ